MQRGHIYQAHGAWHLRYRVNGKQVSVKLTDNNDEYRTLRSVRPLAEPCLQTANSGQRSDGHLTLQQYAETVYFPHAKNNLKFASQRAQLMIFSECYGPSAKRRN